MCKVRVVYMMRMCEGEGVRHVYSEGEGVRHVYSEGDVYDEDV